MPEAFGVHLAVSQSDTGCRQRGPGGRGQQGDPNQNINSLLKSKLKVKTLYVIGKRVPWSGLFYPYKEWNRGNAG